MTGTLALIPQVVDAVRAPVIAAGGIADGRGIVAALSLGAEAVQIGTAFLACDESNAPSLHRDLLFTRQARHTALTRAFSGRLARGVVNAVMTHFETARGRIPPYPVQSWLTAGLKAAAVAAGRTDLMSLWAGQATPLLRHRHADALVHSLVREVEAIIAEA